MLLRVNLNDKEEFSASVVVKEKFNLDELHSLFLDLFNTAKNKYENLSEIINKNGFKLSFGSEEQFKEEGITFK